MSTQKITTFVPKKDQIFILDTNILIKILYPFQPRANMKDYDDFYAKAISAKANILVCAIQISEFINRCIRFQFELWKKEQDHTVDFKKDYRNTDDYRNSMNTILDIVKYDISPVSTYIGDRFNEMELDNLYRYGFSYDFNDALVAEIARLNDAILVTDDRDFANYSSKIHIVTGNKTLLLFH